MPKISKITYFAFGKGYTLQFIQIVDFVPYLVKSHKLNQNLLGLLDSIEISLRIVLYFMYFLCDSLLYFGLLVLFHLDLLLYLLQIVIDIFGMMQLLQFEISLEESNLQSVTEFNLLVFQEGTLIFGTFEVLVAVDRPVVFPSVDLFPLYPDPRLIFRILRFALMDKRTKISNNSRRIVEKNFPTNKFLLVGKVIRLQSFSLRLKVISFVDPLVFLERAIGVGLGWVGCVSHIFLIGILGGCLFHLLT